MLNRYFAPYAEYTLRTKLSEEELHNALKQECGFCSCVKKWIHAFRNERETVPFQLLSRRKGIVLRPCCRGRNSARGEVHLSAGKASCSDETILYVSILPPDMRWFCVLWLGFLLAWTIGVLYARQWYFLTAVPVMLGGFFLVLHLCRSRGAQEVPLVRRSFAQLIKRLTETKNDKAQRSSGDDGKEE